MSLDLADIMREMQAEFLKTVDEKYHLLVAEFQKAEAGDFDLVLREIHSLKGLGTTFDKPEITALCKQAEDDIESLTQWLEKGNVFLQQLRKTCE